MTRDFKIEDLIVPDDDEGPRGDPCVFLGEDGKLHRGWLERKMHADLMEMACDAVPLRPVTHAPEVRLLASDPRRRCESCDLLGIA